MVLMFKNNAGKLFFFYIETHEMYDNSRKF